MTEKRFTYDKPLVAFSKGGINDNVTGETYEFTMDTVLDLLNALHKENQQLKKEINDASKLLDGLTIPELLELVDTYNKENQRIKQTIREAYETERTQIGKNTLKQLLEALE